MAKQPRLPKASSPDRSPASGRSSTFSVGYGKPPSHTRSKPGQSGNPKGRRKGQRNIHTVLDETLSQRIIIREGDRTRSLTKLDAVILTMVNAALKGDAKAQASLITMMRSLGLIGEPPQATNQEPFTPDDAALIEQYFRRHQGKSQPPDSEAKEDSSPSGTTPPERGTAS
jgi:Family of unknown function (DUF5681)